MISMRDPLPLRQSSVWGSFASVEPIPVRYGKQRGKCLQYDSSGLRFVWADHASSIITAVYVDGQINLGWQWRNQTDVTGHAVTMIEFTQAPSGEVSAVGVGKIDAVTGAAITRPGSIIADLAALGGRVIDASWLDHEAVNLGIECAGTLADPDKQLQTIVGEICSSVGALWSARGALFARIYPGGLYQGGSASVEGGWPLPAGSISEASADRSGIINAIIVDYAHRDESPAASIELDCPDSIARFGRRESRIDARWLADARVAESVARRILEWSAEPAWSFTAARSGDVRPLGLVIPAADPAGPSADPAVALASQFDPMTDTTAQIAFERRRQTGAEIRIVRQSTLTETSDQITATVQATGTNRQVRILGTNGGPLANAQVVIDGSVTRYSDGSGWVSFPASIATPGTHTLAVTHPVTRAVTNLQVVFP